MNFLDCAYDILKKANNPLHYTEITRRALADGILDTKGQTPEAIALCRQLSQHPDLETRKQSKNLLYILEAPQLQRRAEWLTQIPDLARLPDSDPRDRRGSGNLATANRSSKAQQEPEIIDPSQINTKDNQFIWVALFAIAAIMIGLIGFGF